MSENLRFCTQCGSRLSPEASACDACGASQEPTASSIGRSQVLRVSSLHDAMPPTPNPSRGPTQEDSE